MGIRERRPAFTFDDHTLKTLEQVREEGLIDRPEKLGGLLTPAPPRIVPFPDPLVELMNLLDAARWQWKLTSFQEHQGERKFYARVWRSDRYGGSRKVAGATRLEALTRAWEAAKASRQTRQQNEKKETPPAGEGRGL